MLSPARAAGAPLSCAAVREHGERRADNVAARTATERDVAVKIEVIEGIGAAHASALSRAGVTHVRHLLQRAATASGREALARETGLSPAQLLEWLNHIDLMRIRGVGRRVLRPARGGRRRLARRARAAQPGTARHAARRNQRGAPLVRRVPSEKVLAGWISEARTLPRLITY